MQENTLSFVIGDVSITLPENLVVATVLERFMARPAIQPTAVSSVPKVGEYWPGQGGINAGIVRGENGGSDYYLIVPTSPEAFTADIKWGGYGENEPGAKSSFDGFENTSALVASEIDYPAAQWASGLLIDGHTDFYLPSRRDLRLTWVNVPELFADGWYWTSTQSGPSTAWCQCFGAGDQGNATKDDERLARAVRRVFVNSVI